MAERKTEIRTIFDGTLSTSCNLPVIARFREIADSLVLMSLLLVLECVGKSNSGRQTGNTNIKILKYTYTNTANCGSHTML